MGAHDGGPTLITSVQRALRLLEAVSAHENGAPAKKLARETGLPLATAYHLLGDKLSTADDEGTYASCFDANSGKQLWKTKLGEAWNSNY